ncbi:MAG: prenyltransferase/squalene oxidase repeat-containing protein, partial [Planctomycetaceae bacterium]
MFYLGSGSAYAFQDRVDVAQQKRIDEAIVRALRFLSEEQTLEGSWRAGKFGDSTATTSLAVMSYMAAGHTPGEGPYGTQINRGIRWVLAQQQPNGMLVGKGRSHGPMYSHGISSLMLAEVYGMVDSGLAKQVKSGLERAIKLILAAQNHRKEPTHRGGWRYYPTSTDSDLSVSAWQLLALRAAKDAGCDVPAENIDDAILYIRRLRTRGNAGFGYQTGHGSSATRAGTGILALEVCGDHHSKEVLGAADTLIRRPLNSRDAYFYYGAYYCTVGMFKVGGEYWERIRPILYETILAEQGADGSWLAKTGSERKAGHTYATCMSVLALAVEYRFLP